MLTLLVVVAVGLLLAFVSGQNSVPVSLRLGSALFPGIPLYVVVLGSFFIGIFLSWILSFFGWASSTMRLNGKNKEINKYQQSTADLHNKIRQLELENAQLRGEKKSIQTKEVVKEELPRGGLIDQVRDRFSPAT